VARLPFELSNASLFHHLVLGPKSTRTTISVRGVNARYYFRSLLFRSFEGQGHRPIEQEAWLHFDLDDASVFYYLGHSWSSQGHRPIEQEAWLHFDLDDASVFYYLGHSWSRSRSRRTVSG
jgi:hypothetical protein